MTFEFPEEKNKFEQPLAHLLDNRFSPHKLLVDLEPEQLHRILPAFHRITTQGAQYVLLFGFI